MESLAQGPTSSKQSKKSFKMRGGFTERRLNVGILIPLHSEGVVSAERKGWRATEGNS